MDVLNPAFQVAALPNTNMGFASKASQEESLLLHLAMQGNNAMVQQYLQLLNLYSSQADATSVLSGAKVFPFPSLLNNSLKAPNNTKILENQTALALAGLQQGHVQSMCSATLSECQPSLPLPARERHLPNKRKRSSARPVGVDSVRLEGKLSSMLKDRVNKLVALLEKVERPRTWTPEETFCVVLTVVENETLVKQARYKELHQEFQDHMTNIFGQCTKKTRQAFWARHCRIREKLGAEEYEKLFWHGKEIPVDGMNCKRAKKN